MEVVNKILLDSFSIHKTKNTLKINVNQYYTPVDESNKTLISESRFEYRNLNIAIKMSDDEYNLMFQNCINPNGHIKWFFFRISNTFKGETVKSNMLNLSKPDSHYNYRMKIL